MMPPLTPAELKALEALARYETAREAGTYLGLTEQTIRNQAQSAYAKLSVRTKVGAFRQLGWLRPPRHIAEIGAAVASA